MLRAFKEDASRQKTKKVPLFFSLSHSFFFRIAKDPRPLNIIVIRTNPLLTDELKEAILSDPTCCRICKSEHLHWWLPCINECICSDCFKVLGNCIKCLPELKKAQAYGAKYTVTSDQWHPHHFLWKRRIEQSLLDVWKPTMELIIEHHQQKN